MKDQSEIEDMLNDMKNKINSEFEIPKDYFNALASDLKLNLLHGESEVFEVPDSYHEQNKMDLKRVPKGKIEVQRSLRLKRVWIAIGSVAAMLLLSYIVDLKQIKGCITYACLLDKTEITLEDIEYFEEYEETGFYIEEDY